MEQYVYIASHHMEGGILRCKLTDQGKLEQLEVYPVDRPAYLCREKDRLYAVLREPFQMQSGVATFEIQREGRLCRLGEMRPTHGTVSAHILAVNGQVYTANYLSGSTTCLPDRVLAHNGRSVDPRQDCSHPHCLTLTPDGQYLCICDLGTDIIYICDHRLEEVCRVALRPGSGPRHLVFSPDGRYAFTSDELSSTVSVFSYEAGVLKWLHAYPALPQGYTGENYASAIRITPDGRQLYVSNRGHDSVCVWDVEGAELSNQRFLLTGGISPREMNLAGEWLLCGNDGSGTVTVFSRKTGARTDTLAVAHPWCILPVTL